MKQAMVLFLIIVTFIIGCTKEQTPKINPEDVTIEAKLNINENERLSYKDYMLEIVIDKEFGENMIYPYMEGIGYMSFDSNEAKEAYYLPGSVGTSLSDEEMVHNELRKNNIIDVTDDFQFSSLIGFYTPEDKGRYQLRMYFEKDKNFDGFDDMYLVYLHKEDDNKWSKLIEIESEID
ncbi:hypothetical protein [Aquibacillus albus]|uniref:Uncharacterized protein n=1 Tax=Aquibacillus albus TaxID=1168171 RepID=A0ABS2MW49_9BACI|nr:hypothetical protein [Aquibacillus albus]MBM7569925.1 hypothetical protein [Aquibacillus albus]